MGQNSQEVAYGFGQLGSAYSDKAVEIIPPKDHVIIAIQFLADSTPIVMTPERLDEGGAGYAGITGTTAATVLDFEETITSNINFAGVVASNITDGTYPIASTTASPTGNILLGSPPTDTDLIKVGQYVMLVDDGATENGSTAMAYDTSATGTPFPIYNGPHKTGVRVTAKSVSSVGAIKVALDKEITASGEALLFLDETHGAGGITSASQEYPKGAVIYGRWTCFKGEADKGVMVYFGK